MDQQRGQNFRVGLFLAIALALGILATVMLGGTKGLFEDYYKLHCSFGDVAGLRQGASVRLAGIDVGEVTTIRLPDDPQVKDIFVQLSMNASFAPRIREDSIARIETEGMLGDKYISISVGSPEEPELLHDAWLATETSTSLLEYQERATEVLNDVSIIARKVKLLMGDESEVSAASVARLISSLENILVSAEQGDGLIHALVYDGALASRVGNVASELELAARDFSALADAVRTGDGLANQLIYGEQGPVLAGQLSGLADAIGGVVHDLQSEESLLHALLYDPERTEMVDDLEAVVSDLRTLVDGVEAGKGTIGMLAQDPSLYEEMRSLVGGAQRSKLLRSYIRKTIEEGEERDAASWSDTPEE
jgi:phospholipid/cholesterol/gamma-HCH transport system substrate-binding protein